MAKSPKASTARKPKIDLAKAQVADGALHAPRSVYEVIGARDTQYSHSDYASYQKWLQAQDLITLQDHAYKLGVVATANMGHLVDRLERRFLKERSRFPAQIQPQANTASDDIRARAEAIMKGAV